jgi:Flp pilus assembly pilin Flp
MRKPLRKNRAGQGLTEYVMMIALVSLALILLLGIFRNAVGNVYRNSRNTLNNVAVVQVDGATGGTTTGGTTTGGTTTGGTTTGGTTTGGTTTGGFLGFLAGIFGSNLFGSGPFEF